MMQRIESKKYFQQWIYDDEDSGKSLLIVGAPYTGKTFLVKQLEDEPQLAAVHYCSWVNPESIETATLLHNLARQLTQQFPNLVIPKFKTTTLLTAQESVIRNFLIKPLLSIPMPSSTRFVVIDGIEHELIPTVIQLSKLFPKWLKLAITSRHFDVRYRRMLEQYFIIHQLDRGSTELLKFIETRLPNIDSSVMLEACQGSWFYVDQYSYPIQSHLLSVSPASDSQNDILNINICSDLPIGHEGLFSAIESVMSPHLNFYLQLITSSRLPPARQKLVCITKIVTGKSGDSIEQDLIDCKPVLQCSDPLILKAAWQERFRYNCSEGHGLWVDGIRRLGCQTAQELIEFAYHLAHAKGWNYRNKIEILRDFGADIIQLKCPVIDRETNELLRKAGAQMLDQSCQSDFVYGCSNGNEILVSEMISTVNDDDTAYGLIIAASRGHTEICRLILEKRPNAAHYVDAQHWNAFRSAACNNNVEIIDLLTKYGVDVDECGHEGRTALRAAAWSGQKSIVIRLLEYNADVNKKDVEGRSALMASSYKNHFDIVSILLQAGADPNLADKSGATALHLALSNQSDVYDRHQTIIELLQNGADVNLEDINGWNCVHVAAYHGDLNLESIIKSCRNVDAQDKSGRTALMLAACLGNTRSCQQLIDHGADIDFIDNEGRTALIHAAIHNNLEIVQLLLNLGADEAHKDNDGAVALHFAVSHRNLDLCSALCTSVTVQISDKYGNHPLIIAAQRSDVKVVQLLLDTGAPINLQSHNGQSALRSAALAGNDSIVKCLAAHVSVSGEKCDLNQCDLNGTPLLHALIVARNMQMVSLLLDLGCSISSCDSYHRYSTHFVAQVNDVNIAAILKEHGGNFEAQDEAGRTPLMTAVWASSYDIAYFLLEDIGVQPNEIDYEGATALNIAAHIGQRDLVILLLKFGAEPSHCDKLGRTAADVAQLAGHESIRQILKNASGSADSSGFGSLPMSPSDQTMKYIQKKPDIRANTVNFTCQKALSHYLPHS